MLSLEQGALDLKLTRIWMTLSSFKLVSVLLMMSAGSCVFFSSAVAGAAKGEWPMWRCDPALTGFQPLPGAMKKSPRILAKHFLGAGPGVQTLADLNGTGEKSDVIITARSQLTAYDAKGKLLWENAPADYVISNVEWVDDLDGDGRNEVVAVAGHMGGTRQAYLILDGRTGKLGAAIEVNTGDFASRGHCGSYIPGEKGKQIFLVTSTQQAESGPATSNGQVELWSFDGKTAVRRWKWTPTEFMLLYPSVLIGDLDGDGHPQAIINSWCRIWKVDLTTGAVASHTTWDPQGANQRQYGWNELLDVDGDGKLDFINVALTKHVDVVRNNGGKMQLAWTRGWKDAVTTETRSLRPPSDPVADLDGDGRMELVAALFDGMADKRWHLYVWEAATGTQKVEALDLVPMASVALWGTNGGRALLCIRSQSIQYDPPETYEVWRLRGGHLEKIWSSPTASFVLQPVTSNDRRVVYFTSVNMKWAVTTDVDSDGRAEFFTADKSGSPAQAWGIGSESALIAKSGKPPVEPAPSIPSNLPQQQGTMVPHLLAANLNGDRRNEILLYDNATVTVLRLEKDTLRVVKTFASTEIPIVCDLAGDGKPCLLTAGRGTDGNLWLESRGGDGKTNWHFTFPNSAACGQYSERPHFTSVGKFTGRKGFDVFGYSTKPSARAYLLDGATGKPVWERDELPAIERHFQAHGGRAAAWDFNSDKADDVLFCNPDFYCVANGRTGELLVGPTNLQQLVKWWAAYSSPAVLQRKDDAPIVYLGGAYSCRASISLDGKRSLWREYLPTDRWPLMSGGHRFNEGLLPPFKGRGWRGAQVEADGTLVCFDAATGKHLWKMKLATLPSGIISGDVDGNGEPEFVFGGQDGNLLAVRDRGDRGEVLWRKEFDAPVGTPMVADVNGDRRSEIVVSVGDGNVYVLGK